MMWERSGTMSRSRGAGRIAALALGGLVFAAVGISCASPPRLPDGYLGPKQSKRILEKTLTIRLDPDLGHLDGAERRTLTLLIQVGEATQTLYERSRHHQAERALRELRELDTRLGHPRATGNLLQLYRLFKGPTGRGLDGEEMTFLPVDDKVPGRNVYPWGVTKEEINAYLAGHPEERASILAVRTLVRRATPENLRRDVRTLKKYEILGTLHPRLESRLVARLDAEPGGFYAVPYSVAYATELMAIYGKLQEAASTIEETDAEFAGYLRHRAVDLLRDDYEAGDAAWVTGRFGKLNAQIGAYETYDDQLYGVKGFFGVSVLVKDRMMTSSMNSVAGWLQELEDIMPYGNRKTVRQDIPIGVYNVVADFGQARGTNTATILPNESRIVRKYGRTILIRENILRNPVLFEARTTAFKSAVAGEFHADYRPDGDLFRTLFHEIGHYLGPDRTRDGRTLDNALEEDASILEELKADLVSLFVAKRLLKKGYYERPRFRAVEAAGIRRVLRKTPPRKSRVYATMELMQMNYFLDKGLLEFDRSKGKLVIHYDRYHPAVEAMLQEVFELQSRGDKAEADRFIAKYAVWDRNLHGRIAKAMKKAERYRYVLVRYAALGE